MNEEESARYLEDKVAEIFEHFDAVQILVSWNEDALTKCVKRGAGNWYARQGMAHEFINEDIAQENANQIAEQIHIIEGNEPDNDSEEESE